MTTVVKCPSCGAEVRWTPENKFRPFCSARCKQLDLGAWAAEKYRIGGASDEGPSSEEDSTDNRRDS